MQITKVEVTPIELNVRHPMRMANLPEINHVTAVFIRLETRDGFNAWGCTVVHPALTGEKPEDVVHACRSCADLVLDLHPTNIEYSLGELAMHSKASPSVICAFDLAFHDLLSLAAGMPLYRLLGGYRNRIQTSVTIPLSSVEESVERAKQLAAYGFRMLKIKGGINPNVDVQRIEAIHQALPDHVLRLDVDGCYTVQQAIDVTRVLQDMLEMIEQPVAADDLAGLRQVKEMSPVPVLADQSVKGPASALDLAAHRMVDGLSIKLASCGGLRCARQIDSIARAAQMVTMISCFVEPALMISAGLSLALSSPNVRYGDLDGSFDLLEDPSKAGFTLEDGWLVAADVPGLGYTVNFGY